MADEKKLSFTQHISPWTLRETERRPSDLFLRFEADLISRLAYEAAIQGRRFVGWPTVRLTGPDSRADYLAQGWRLVAEVVAK